MIRVNPEFAKFVLTHWGRDAQLGTLAEEANEFSQAYLKYLFRSNKEKNFEKVEEEFADLSIMVEQGEQMLDMERINKIKKKKLLRLHKRITSKGVDAPMPFIEVV